ncbi:Putative auto-transporter adhesin, head GIN domain [Chitinophaga sp. CF118]|uniref:head GIN domain-containing protein n=1 Tax=Chitinophaga sp. CF118 TaxID=1884367 RepID=UPI0008F0E5C7|nr:head GIN domain-containing protein [Chitinophaga sp. CF118]SFD10370.1 Putative auto-transporter adhesin, head GIN domain [Chitinophaga sp. CF118]
MKNSFYCISLTLLAFTLFSCDVRHIKGSGHTTTISKKLGSYHKIEVKGPMDVYLTQGPEQEAVIEGDDNILPYIELVEENDRLIIRQKHNISLSFHDNIKVRLTAPSVTELSLSGSGNIKLINTLDNEEMVKMNVSGSGDISGTVHSPEINVNVTGSGNIKAGGETRDLEVNIAGSGNFEGKSLMAESASVNIAGSGDAEVHASVKLDAKVVGSGDVNYLGNPEVSSKIMGSGSVLKKD